MSLIITRPPPHQEASGPLAIITIYTRSVQPTRAAMTAACERFVLRHSIPNSPTASVKAFSGPRPLFMAAYCTTCISACRKQGEHARPQSLRESTVLAVVLLLERNTIGSHQSLDRFLTSRSCGAATISGTAATAAPTICSAASCAREATESTHDARELMTISPACVEHE